MINALKAAIKALKEASADMGRSWEPEKEYDELMDEAKMIIGIRAASTVTLVRLPTEARPKSRTGLVRETKRLIKHLEVQLPTCVISRLEQAGQ